MGKFEGFVLCSDIDGTLLDDSHKIHPENIKAIEYFRKNGGKFTFASGRTRPSVERIAREIEHDFPAIVSNGCAICDFRHNGEYLWSIPLSDNAEVFARKILSEYPECALGIVNEEGTYFLSDNKTSLEYSKIEKLPHLNGTFETVEKPWLKMLFCQDEKTTAMLWESYGNSKWCEEFKIVHSGKEYFEYFDVSANKGVALKQLAKMYGFSLDNTIAIGDNGNDTEMIAAVKYGATLDNGEECAKKVARITTVSNNQGAVADLIYKLEAML